MSKQFDQDLFHLSKIVRKVPDNSQDLQQRLIKIESYYQAYPRIGSQLVDLYSDIGQKERAQGYLESMTNNLDSYTKNEQFFLLLFSLNFYKKNNYPIELVREIEDRLSHFS